MRPTHGLPRRLQAVVELLDDAAGWIVDVGFDHGLLLDGAMRLGHRRVVGVEVLPALAREWRRRRPDRAVLAADGLRAFRPGGVAQVVIAGLGERTIIEILRRDRAVLRACRRVVLCPSGRPGGLRRWLAAEGWLFLAEDLVREGDRWYRPLACALGDSPLPYAASTLLLGPQLVARPHPELPHYCRDLLHRHRGLWEHLQRRQTAPDDDLAALLLAADAWLQRCQQD